LKLRQPHLVIDGETVVLGPDGVSDFAALHSGKHNEQARLYAFDMLCGVQVRAHMPRAQGVING
jgi:bifunctional non-homologous end joining protein LigD